MSLRCTFWNKITEIFDKIIAKIIFMGSSVAAYAEWQSVHIFFHHTCRESHSGSPLAQICNKIDALDRSTKKAEET